VLPTADQSRVVEKKITIQNATFFSGTGTIPGAASEWSPVVLLFLALSVFLIEVCNRLY